jgi:hypothetical protein
VVDGVDGIKWIGVFVKVNRRKGSVCHVIGVPGERHVHSVLHVFESVHSLLKCQYSKKKKEKKKRQ